MPVRFAWLLGLALAAPPPMPHPVAPPALAAGGRVSSDTRRDFFSRLQSSPSIARGSVRPSAGLTAKDVVLPVHIDAWLKGSGADELWVDFGGLRAVTPEGQAELLFLGPALGDGGAEQRCLQERNEQWVVPDGATARLDQAVRDAVSGGPESRVEAELMGTGPRIAQQAANALGLLASTNPAAVADADAAIRDEANLPLARAALLRFLPSRLPTPTLVAAADARQPAVVRLAALDSLGRAAAHDPIKQQAALPALLAAAKEPDLQVDLAAAGGLAQLQRGEAVAPLDSVLAGSDPHLRAAAVLTLGQLAHAGSPSAAARLDRLQRDPDPAVARRAKSQLALSLPPPPAPAPSRLPLAVVASLAVVGLAALIWRRRRAAR